MKEIGYLTPGLGVTGALAAEDFVEIARRGFKTVISNRPDGEETDQLSARQSAVHAWRAGLVFRHVPAAKHEVLDCSVVDEIRRVLAAVPGPVLMHCKSGLRAAILWAGGAAREGQPIEAVLAAAKAAGFDLDAVRDEIAWQDEPCPMTKRDSGRTSDRQAA